LLGTRSILVATAAAVTTTAAAAVSTTAAAFTSTTAAAAAVSTTAATTTAVAATTTTVAAATTTAWGTWLHRTGFVDDKTASAQRLTVHAADGSLCLSIRSHFHKTKAF
jgi:hypothetical protein